MKKVRITILIIFTICITIVSIREICRDECHAFQKLKRLAFKRDRFHPRSFFYESSEQSKRKYDRIKEVPQRARM